jgi:hypothetical protein
MANRNFPQSKVFGFHLLPVRVRASITIGASGAVASSSGPGTKAISKMGTGVYRIQLQDSYASFLHMSASMIANGVSGSAIDPNAGVVGTLYQITVVGNTNWATAGIPSSVVPAVGQVFALAAAPSSGTGRVKAAAISNIQSIQLAGSPNSGMVSLLTQSQGNGGFVTIVCLAPTDAATTTLIPTNPASGDIVLVDMLFNSSQVQ